MAEINIDLYIYSQLAIREISSSQKGVHIAVV